MSEARVEESYHVSGKSPLSPFSIDNFENFTFEDNFENFDRLDSFDDVGLESFEPKPVLLQSLNIPGQNQSKKFMLSPAESHKSTSSTNTNGSSSTATSYNSTNSTSPQQNMAQGNQRVSPNLNLQPQGGQLKTSPFQEHVLKASHSQMSLNSMSFPKITSNMEGNGQTLMNNMSIREAQAAVNLNKKLPELTNLVASRNPIIDSQAKERLDAVLNRFILLRCNINEHCRKVDFDGAALEALNKLCFLQAMQTVEHFAVSVSPRIQKRSAYLMGILRGQESHWQNSRAAELLSGGAAQLLNLPPQLLLVIGQCCLDGNCLPSDFTPDVCLSLHSLTMPLAMKAVSAFNSNKRIVAGCRGGVLNRARFFQRLIQNVSDQNLAQTNSLSNQSISQAQSGGTPYSSQNNLLQLQLLAGSASIASAGGSLGSQTRQMQKFCSAPSNQNLNLLNSNNQWQNGSHVVGSPLGSISNTDFLISSSNKTATNLVENQSRLQRQQTDSVLYTHSLKKVASQGNVNDDLGPIGSPIKRLSVDLGKADAIMESSYRESRLNSIQISSTNMSEFMFGGEENSFEVDEFSVQPTQKSDRKQQHSEEDEFGLLDMSKLNLVPETVSSSQPNYHHDQGRDVSADRKNSLLEQRVHLLEMELRKKIDNEKKAQNELSQAKEQVVIYQKKYLDLKMRFSKLIQSSNNFLNFNSLNLE